MIIENSEVNFFLKKKLIFGGRSFETDFANTPMLPRQYCSNGSDMNIDVFLMSCFMYRLPRQTDSTHKNREILFIRYLTSRYTCEGSHRMEIQSRLQMLEFIFADLQLQLKSIIIANKVRASIK